MSLYLSIYLSFFLSLSLYLFLHRCYCYAAPYVSATYLPLYFTLALSGIAPFVNIYVLVKFLGIFTY
jgi:hypothetical protein